MVNQPLDRNARTLADRLDRAATIIPTIRNHLNEQRRNLNHLRSTNHDGTRNHGPTDPTARYVIDLHRIDTLEGYIDDALASIRVGVNLLDEACHKALGHRTPTTAPTDPICHVAGCSDFVASYRLRDGTVRFRMSGDHAGLCPRHRIAAQRNTP